MSELDHPCKGVCSGWMQGFEKGQREALKILGAEKLQGAWRLNLIKAVEAQAKDETLWCVNCSQDGKFTRLPVEGPPVTVGEAYVQQSLRWLHQVIEENDLNALESIIAQSKGDI